MSCASRDACCARVRGQEPTALGARCIGASDVRTADELIIFEQWAERSALKWTLVPNLRDEFDAKVAELAALPQLYAQERVELLHNLMMACNLENSGDETEKDFKETELPQAELPQMELPQTEYKGRYTRSRAAVCM